MSIPHNKKVYYTKKGTPVRYIANVRFIWSNKKEEWIRSKFQEEDRNIN